MEKLTNKYLFAKLVNDELLLPNINSKSDYCGMKIGYQQTFRFNSSFLWSFSHISHPKMTASDLLKPEYDTT